MVYVETSVSTCRYFKMICYFKNISLNKLNVANLETNLNLNYNSHYYHYHFYIIYIFLIIIIFILILIIVVHCKKKIYVDRTAQDKVASSPNSLEENSNDSNDLNNDIPTDALKVAKKARSKKKSK